MMSSLWRQSRFLRNESKIFTTTINKSKEPKSSVGNFFDFIKQWWFFITIGSYLFMVSISVFVYTDMFSGDIINATDYVQNYVINNSYRVIFFLIITIMPISMIFYPWFSLSYMFYKEPKGENKSKFEKVCKLINMYIVSFGPLWVIFIVFVIFYSLLSSSLYPTTLRNGSQIFNSATVFRMVSGGIILSLVIFGFIYATLSGFSKIFIFVMSIFSILLYIFSILFVFRIFIFSYSGVSCVVDSYNSKNSGRTSLPVSYDTRGVHVFTGNYDPSTGKWINVHREYLQFEKGYKVTSGACKPNSSTSSK